MNFKLTLLTIICIGALNSCSETSKKEVNHPSYTPVVLVEANSTEKEHEVSEEMELLENRQKKTALENTLKEEKLKSTHTELLQQLQKIKWDKEIISEKFALQQIEDEKQSYEEKKRQQEELDVLVHQSSLSEAKAKQLEMKLALKRSTREFNQNQVESEISFLEIKKQRDAYISPELTYLDNPLSDDNKTLTISDRRIDLNGVITYDMATSITKQINYFNNKDSKKPIFIVIDRSEGGEIMAGNIIIRSIDSSKAPVYVVLKSFAASMTAVIITLADRSFAYPQAIMLHHQPMAFSFGGMTNLTEEKEKYESLKKWWNSLGTPIAKKMGISSDEFIKLMYKHSSSGDWEEFATEAHKLKWVNNIIMRIEDKSVVVDPLYQKQSETTSSIYGKVVEEEGKTFVYLPRLRPSDAYFIYNPDGYYRVR